MELIRLDIQTNEKAVDLLARRHVAVLVVAMTMGATGLLAVAIGQTGAVPATVVAVTAATIVGTQVRAFGKLAEKLEEGRTKATRAIERFIAQEVEADVDETSEA